MQELSLSAGTIAIINSSSFLSTNSEDATPAATDPTAQQRSRLQRSANPSEYYVDAEADSLVFWLTGFNDGSAPDPQLRLTSPSGTQLTPSSAQSRADADYQENRSAGFAFYYLEDPEAGLWSVSYDEDLSQATLSVPVAGSEIGLNVAFPDTVRTVGNEISTRIVGPPSEACTNTQVQSSLFYRQEAENPLSNFGPIALTPNGNAYEGSFMARQSGTYLVSTELTCDTGGQEVRRQSIRPVSIGGGNASTNTPAAPANLSATPRSEGQTTLSWEANPEGDLRAYLLYRSTRSGSETLLDTLSAGTTTYRDENLSDGQSYFYRLKALDVAGNESDFSDTALTRASVLNVSVRQSFGNAEEPQNYRLVALPGASETSVASTLDGEAGDAWRVFWDNGQSGSKDNYLVEHDGSDRFQFAPGRGFWMLGESAWQSSGEVETVSLDEDGTYSIDLHDGWNIVSNPFGVGVDWNVVQQANDVTQTLWRWNGSYQEASSFASAQTGRAYYFFNEQGLDELTLPYPTGADTDASATEEGQTQEAGAKAPPSLTLRATAEDDSLASGVTVGRAENAEDGFDARDQYAPPGAFTDTRLHLTAPFEAESGHDRLAAEYRPAGSEGQRFEVVLQTDETASPVTLRAEGAKDAFDGQTVALVNRRTAQRYDLRERSSVRVQPETDTTRFSLLVGPPSFVEREARRIAPQEAKLLGSYPNPFRTQATIAYAVPEPSRVRLLVYDLLGRRVRTLVDDRQQPGRKQARFEGRGLSSGVYVYRLEIGDYRATGKVVLVR